MSSLIYQVCWQRLCFGAFGVDIESITIIVSTFMLGLGCGALIGGRMATRAKGGEIRLFASFEFGIGLFGIASPFIIPAVGQLFMSQSVVVIALVNFCLMLIPTTFMGATLPILVSYCVHHDNSVGEAVGVLYFFNTLGAAVGAFLAGVILFIFVTVTTSIYFAAAVNIAVAALAYAYRTERRPK